MGEMQYGRESTSSMICGLCNTGIVDVFFKDSRRGWTYWECPKCELVFRDPQSYLAQLQEKARYQTHNNSIEDSRYVQFLSPALDAVVAEVAPGGSGLDYGCGPGPTLSLMLHGEGYSCGNYDPLFFPDKGLLNKSYDFVTCTEVVEHFYRPLEEFQKINRLLAPGSLFVVMTDHRRLDRSFDQWGYRTDVTHVCFFNKKSWDWVASRFEWDWISFQERLAVFRKG